MKKYTVSSGGGAAASLPTFLGCDKKASKTLHLAQSTTICLKCKKNSPSDKIASSVESVIQTKIPFEFTISCIEDAKTLKVNITFIRPEDLEKSKSLLKILEIPFTDKGKISNRKPEVSVVQPKKSEQKEESAEGLEEFPLGIFGIHYLASSQPMFQSEHKFLHPLIRLMLRNLKIDDTKWKNIVKLSEYMSHDLDGSGMPSICIAHPNNPEAQQQIVQMQQSSSNRTDLDKNWKLKGFIFVPEKILEIPAYWTNNYLDDVTEIQEPDPATLISHPISSDVSPYPVFDPDSFLQRLRDIEPILVQSGTSGASQDNSPFWLKDAVFQMLYQKNERGNITQDLKIRFAQMIEVNFYHKNQKVIETFGGEIIPGFDTRVTPGDILVVYPGANIESLVERMKGKDLRGIETTKYNHIGKILIPHQFLMNMPEVWVNLKRSSYSSSH
jgi:hypothetical protein